MGVIELEDFSYSYRSQDDRALDDVTLSVEEGEFLGVVGSTGAGKTTLLSSMCGIIPYHQRGDRSGTVTVKGRPIEEYGSLYNLASTVSMVREDPDTQLFNLHVFDEVIWGLENFGTRVGLDEEEIRTRGHDALQRFGLEGFERNITYNLSGGEKQKVAIASVYAMDLDVILLDEPTSQLDPIGTEMVFEAIDTLVREGITIVMVEHKIEELVRYADRIAHIEDGAIRHVAEPRAFFSGEGEDYEPPPVTELGRRLADAGWETRVPLTLEEAVEEYSDAIGAKLDLE